MALTKEQFDYIVKVCSRGVRVKKNLAPLFGPDDVPMQFDCTYEHDMSGEHTEEISLLGVLHLDGIEMMSMLPNSCSTIRVRTDRGDLFVGVQGSRGKPAILTYHDLGLNYTSFLSFFDHAEMQPLLEHFCIYHITAPGQEEHAPNLRQEYVYPTMDELANQLNYVLSHFGIQTFIGFGVGAGANILARYALSQPQRVEALVLINCISTKESWFDWLYQKRNIRALRLNGMTESVKDHLEWHYFGKWLDERNIELRKAYRSYFTQFVNPWNLSQFIEAYIQRSDLGILRGGETIRAPVLNITGSLSPHAVDTVVFNGRLHPENSTWMKISDCANVLEQQPAKVAQAFRLFLQGEGYVAPLSPTKIALFRRLSDPGRRRCRHSTVMRITENPISEAMVC